MLAAALSAGLFLATTEAVSSLLLGFLAGAAPEPVPRRASGAAPADGPARHRARVQAALVPHPFLGLTVDPTADPAVRAAVLGDPLAVDEHGLLASPRVTPSDVVVAIVGGSMSVDACLDGAEAIARALRSVPDMAAKTFGFRCLGHGGFKQPQALQTIAYLMALGQRLDAVVLLDGFNDVAVTYDEVRRGSFVAYPRDWGLLVAAAFDPARAKRIARIGALEEARVNWAQRFDASPLGATATLSLVRMAVDRQLERALQQTRRDLAELPAGAWGYRELGPGRPLDDQEVVERSVALWFNASRALAALCAGAGLRYHHFLQPNQYDRGSKPLAVEERARSYREDSPYRVPVELAYPRLRAAGVELTRQGVPFTDLSRIFESEPRPLYDDDCCHLSPTGNAALGEAIGRTLAAHWSRPPTPHDRAGARATREGALKPRTEGLR